MMAKVHKIMTRTMETLLVSVTVHKMTVLLICWSCLRKFGYDMYCYDHDLNVGLLYYNDLCLYVVDKAKMNKMSSNIHECTSVHIYIKIRLF